MGLAALLGFLLVGSVVAAVLNARRLEGSVPGRAAILGLAASPEGFLLGTSDGVLSSSDGLTWERVAGFHSDSLVAGSAAIVAVVSERRLHVAPDLKSFRPVPAQLDRPTALTVTRRGRVWVADRSVLLAGDTTGLQASTPLEDGPQEVLSLGVLEESGQVPELILAGGLSSGLWRLDDTAAGWQRVLGTPIRAILMDPVKPGRYLLGTAGGVLVAGPTAPEFTDLRLAVEALAESDGTYYAITADRLIYSSQGGSRWSALAAGKE